MSTIPYRSALIIGAGPGISASLTRSLRSAGLSVVIAARDTGKLKSLAEQTGAIALRVDASDPSQVERLFAQTDAHIGPPEVVIYNASGRVRGPLTDLDPSEVERGRGRFRVGCILLGTASRQAHACSRQGRDPADGCYGRRKGLRQLGTVRHGEIRAARAGTKCCERTGSEGNSCRPCGGRWGCPERASRRSRGGAG
jgi:hypothetical protein